MITAEARFQIEHAQAELAKLDILQARHPDHGGIPISRQYWQEIIADAVAEMMRSGDELAR